MSTITNPLHSYFLRARTGKPETKVVPAAGSISDQEISDQNDSNPVSHRLFSDVVSGNTPLKLRGGHDNPNNISEEEQNLQTFELTKRSEDQENLTPDQNIDHWTTINPNRKRRSQSLSSLDEAIKTTRLKVAKPAEIDLVAAAETKLTTAQKDNIEWHYGRMAKSKPTRLPSVTSFGKGPSKKKGKGIDPSNWGNADISEEELDPDALSSTRLHTTEPLSET